MITKAFIEEIVSPYEVKVRIPLLDRSTASSLATSRDKLNIATICTLPNCYVNLQVGDVVFVGFEDNTYYKAVVLGHLSREAATNTYADVTFGNLTINTSAVLTEETTIWEITPTNIKHLKISRDNLQSQIDALTTKIERLQSTLDSILQD